MSELFNLVAEGFSSLRFGCTMALAFLGVAPVLAGRSRAALVAGIFWFTAALSGWARFADLWFAPPESWLLAVLGTGLAVAVGAMLLRPGVLTGAVASAYSGLVAGWLWVPCVGRYLSDPLNEAASEPAANVVPIFSYVFGVSLPLLVLAAVPWAWPRLVPARDSRAGQGVAAVLSVILAVAVSTGLYSEFVVRFSG